MEEPFDLGELARLEEARQAAGIADVADERQAVGGGLMCRGMRGTWVNTAVGMGLSGAVDPGVVDEVIAWHEAVGMEPRVEVCPFTNPGLLSALADRKFVVRMFENVLFREVRAVEVVRGEAVGARPEGLEIGVVEPADAARVREYAEVVATGFCAPGVAVREEDVEVAARCARHARTVALMARIDGRCAGAGALDVLGPVAGLYGLSVLPEFRRRGVQRALIAHRLNLAAARGVRVATIGSRPGVATERNARRMGFQVGYTKVALVRPGDGLWQVVG